MSDKAKNKQPRFYRRLRSNITFNIISGILVLLIIISFISICIGYWQFSDLFTEEYSNNTLRIAHAAASYLDPDTFDAYYENRENAESDFSYQLSVAFMQDLCDKVDAEFIYVIQPDTTDYAHITFIFNIVNADSPFDAYKIGYVRDTTNDDYREKYQRLYEGKSTEEIVVRDKGYIESGSHITAMISLSDSDSNVKGILCVQRQMDALHDARIKFTVRVLIVLAIMIVLAVVVYGFFLNRTLIRPIKKITKETARFAKEPSRTEKLLGEQIDSRDEIGVLADSVDLMESETLNYIDNLTKATAERQRIGTELELASQIQQNMLNHVFPENASFDIYASMDPAKEVGGDFYDFFMIDDDHLGIVIADVSGKGIPAALFMMISKIVIADAAMTIPSPSEILRTVNERICKNNQLDMFVTVWLGILELSTGKLTASNAGHEYPVIYRKDRSFELLRDKHGFVIGGMSGVKYTDYELTLRDGDAIFVYTDGLPEATDSSEQLFGTERMLSALNSNPHTMPFAIISQVRAQVDAFVGDAPQFDDLTMLCLKYKSKPESQDQEA